FGVGASTLLTLIVIPVLYYSLVGERTVNGSLPPPSADSLSGDGQPDSRDEALADVLAKRQPDGESP
ncbi:MAG: hypothetical protein KGJ14_01045, partial [Nitrospirota bacterium]|nr:hypothetical protein [Nitrospirota bacterium]